MRVGLNYLKAKVLASSLSFKKYIICKLNLFVQKVNSLMNSEFNLRGQIVSCLHRSKGKRKICIFSPKKNRKISSYIYIYIHKLNPTSTFRTSTLLNVNPRTQNKI